MNTDRAWTVSGATMQISPAFIWISRIRDKADLGSQYTSQAFENCLSSREMLHSFSRKGNPYDNACIESFHSVLKKEEIYLHTYQDAREARRAIFEYIEGWYNRKRIHSAIGYMTPQQKEDEELKKAL